jgi:hypothetical protein
MAEWLCCSVRTTKVLYSNHGATRHRMTLGQSLTAVCLGSPGRCILIICDIHRPSVQSYSCREDIRLSKLSPDSTLYHKAGYSFFHTSFWINTINVNFVNCQAINIEWCLPVPIKRRIIQWAVWLNKRSTGNTTTTPHLSGLDFSIDSNL